MRSWSRTLPIRWQITMLHAAILSFVLAGSGLLLYVQERTFLLANTANRLRAQAQPIFDTHLGPDAAPLPPPPRVRPKASVLVGAPDPALTARLPQFADDLAARDTAAVILTLDGTMLARGSLGPSPPSPDRRALERAAAGAENERFLALGGKERMLATLIPIRHAGAIVALAQLSTPTRPIDDAINRLALYLLAGWGFAVSTATVLGVTATRRVLRPLDHIVRTTYRIAAGDLRQRVGLLSGQPELAQLGAAFDAMVARLETAFTAQRRFVADAAHELRTPLTALSASTELLLIGADENDPIKTQRLLQHLDTELTRVIRLTNDLLTLSSLDAQPQFALSPLDVSDLVSDVGEHSRGLLHGQQLHLDVTPGLWVNGDADRLRQVLLNIVDNARKYTPSGGTITLHATREAREVCVLVEDTGVGIPVDALPHLFERFYRVDSARSRRSGGSGLGLAIAQALMRAHGGRIDINSAPDAGTRVRLYLPLLDRSGNLQTELATLSSRGGIVEPYSNTPSGGDIRSDEETMQ